MIRAWSTSLLLAGVLAGGACSPAAPPPPAAPPAPVADAPADIAALNAARTAFMSGYEKGDADAIGGLYHTDAISESNGQPTLKGREAIVASLKGMFQHVSVTTTLTPDETRTLGDVGLDRGHYSVTVTPKSGAPAVTGQGRYMVIYVKGPDGTWRVSRDMDNAAGAPPPAPAEDSTK
jgi:uncharacterized protein (TIGR02246 family)